MAICGAIKADGIKCATRAMKGSQWCFNHSPDHSEQRRHNASKGGRAGGRGRPGAGEEVLWLRQTLKQVVNEVLTGSMDRSRAAVAVQGLNALRGLLETEHRIKEAQEFEERIAVLETRLAEQQSGAGYWARN
jgi:hypothetical protein